MVRSVARVCTTASHSGDSIGIEMRQIERSAFFGHPIAAPRITSKHQLGELHSGYPIETQPMTAVGQAEDAAKHGRY